MEQGDKGGNAPVCPSVWVCHAGMTRASGTRAIRPQRSLP